MSVSKVTRNYQITLPPEVRLLQHIEIGDKITFTVEQGKIQLLKIKESILDDAFGIWGKGTTGKTELKKIRSEWDKREQAP